MGRWHSKPFSTANFNRDCWGILCRKDYLWRLGMEIDQLRIWALSSQYSSAKTGPQLYRGLGIELQHWAPQKGQYYVGRGGWKRLKTKFLGLIILLRDIPNPCFIDTQLLGNPVSFPCLLLKPLIRVRLIPLNFTVAGDGFRWFPFRFDWKLLVFTPATGHL